MKFLTIRNVPADVAQALQEERRRRGISLNRLVLDLLRQALGLGFDQPTGNGLEKLAGDWSQKDLEDFEAATAVFEKVDDEQWR